MEKSPTKKGSLILYGICGLTLGLLLYTGSSVALYPAANDTPDTEFGDLLVNSRTGTIESYDKSTSSFVMRYANPSVEGEFERMRVYITEDTVIKKITVFRKEGVIYAKQQEELGSIPEFTSGELVDVRSIAARNRIEALQIKFGDLSLF